MASNTSRLGLLKKDTATDGNDTFNIKTMLNDNWDLIDAKVATLGADGKVPADQLSISVNDASTTQKGVVMLEDGVTSTSITKAATPNSVKQVNDSLTSHKADLVSHVTQADKDKWNATDIAKFKKGSSIYTDNDTSQTFTDTFCTVNSLVTIVITSGTNPQGIWSVTSADGNFTITSTVAESADITFDYFIQKAVG